MDTKARFGPTESSSFDPYPKGSIVTMETTDLSLSKTGTEFYFFFFFKYTSVSKIEGIIFGREDLFSLSRYLYLERKSKVPKRQKISSSETKFSSKQASLTTLVQRVRTNEQLFPGASFRLSGASFRFSCICLPGGLGSWASPFPRWSEGLAVIGQDGVKRWEAPARGRPGKG